MARPLLPFQNNLWDPHVLFSLHRWWLVAANGQRTKQGNDIIFHDWANANTFYFIFHFFSSSLSFRGILLYIANKTKHNTAYILIFFRNNIPNWLTFRFPFVTWKYICVCVLWGSISFFFKWWESNKTRCLFSNSRIHSLSPILALPLSLSLAASISLSVSFKFIKSACFVQSVCHQRASKKHPNFMRIYAKLIFRWKIRMEDIRIRFIVNMCLCVVCCVLLLVPIHSLPLSPSLHPLLYHVVFFLLYVGRGYWKGPFLTVERARYSHKFNKTHKLSADFHQLWIDCCLFVSV